MASLPIVFVIEGRAVAEPTRALRWRCVQQIAKTYVQEQCITCHGFHEGVDRVITLLQRVVNGDDEWLHRKMRLSEMGDPLAKM
jgi:NADH:ubiquinone oxidoreductase subunit F (NADH-binding)